MKIILIVLMALLTLNAGANEISGKVFGKNCEPMAGANVVLSQGGKVLDCTITDFDGLYVFKPLEAGYYDVMAICSGYDSIVITSVAVVPETETSQDFIMRKATGAPKSVKMKYTVPIMDGKGNILTKNELKTMPVSGYEEWGFVRNCHPTKYPGSLNLGGAREPHASGY